MQITVKLYGTLKRYASGGKTQFELELAPDDTLEDVLVHLDIPYDDTHVFLINGRRADKSSYFRNRDTLVMFPEISGG
jgi:molybdopterin converting factor small subunit